MIKVKKAYNVYAYESYYSIDIGWKTLKFKSKTFTEKANIFMKNTICKDRYLNAIQVL